MIPTDIHSLFYNIYLLFSIGALSLIVHEVAHLKTLRKHGKKPVITFDGNTVEVGKPKDYEGLDKKQLQEVYFSGVVWGFLVVTPAIFVIYPPFAVGLYFLYLLGCKSDFIAMRNLK